MKTISRNKNLATAELSGETVIYDLGRHRAHCLNAMASAVWRFCEGASTTGAIARRMHHQLGWVIDEALVGNALQQLQVAGLIETGKLAHASRTKSRSARRISLVSSIVVPTAVAAQSRGGRQL